MAPTPDISHSPAAADCTFASHVEFDTVNALSKLDPGQLQQMQLAGEEMFECLRVLTRVDRTLIHEVIDGEERLEFHTHYPKTDDIRDEQHASQFYYHQHRDDPAEHGHFHLYLRAPGIPSQVRPSKKYRRKKWPPQDQQFAQLFAISINNHGLPFQIFTNNRWVAHETFFDAPMLVKLVDRFKIDHAWPSWPLNRWISAFPVFFKPQIEAVIIARDKVLNAYAIEHPGKHILEDQNLEVVSTVAIDMQQQMAAIRSALTI